MGAEFHDFAGSVVVHAVGGWIASPQYCCSAHDAVATPRMAWWLHTAVIDSVPGTGRLDFDRRLVWLQRDECTKLDSISGLVAINSLMAMAGGTLVATWIGKNDPGFIHNGPLAGLAVRRLDPMHPDIGALIVGGIAGLFVWWMFTITQNKWKNRRRITRRMAIAWSVRHPGADCGPASSA